MNKDCFGYVAGKNCCSVLTENVCETRKCSFYMNKTEYRRKIRGAAPEEEEPVQRGKAVRCVETGEVFISARRAAYEYGCTGDEVSKCCKGKVKRVRGFTFEYVEVE